MLTEYDASRPVDRDEWLELDDDERSFLVESYHERLDEDHPDLSTEEQRTLHTTIHVIVENQVALGDGIPVQAKLDRLMAEGLGRHEAVHAIGSVLSAHMHDLMTGKVDGSAEELNARYYRELEGLTARSWREEYADDSSQQPARKPKRPRGKRNKRRKKRRR